MDWKQIYDPLGNIWLSAFVAGIPLYILFYLLAVKRAKGHVAAFCAVTTALLLSIFVWKMPVSLALNSFAFGALFGIFPIVWIVICGVWVYFMTVESGEFEIIKNSLASITDDRRLQALFIAFAFGAFIEGTAGFGTPVAITAAMLVGLGFNPTYAAAICLIANTAPVAFGSIGIPLVTAANVTGLDLMTLSKIAGRQLPLLSIIVPMWLSVTMCGFKRSFEIMPAILVAGFAFASAQCVFSNFHGPYLPDIMSAIVTILALLTLLKFWKPKATWHFPDEPAPTGKACCDYPAGQVLRAWGPYIVLAIMVLLWGLQDIKALLAPFGFTFQWPGLHNLVTKMPPIVPEGIPAAKALYPAVYNFNFGQAAGTAVLIGGLISVSFMPNYGYGKAIACLGSTIKKMVFPIITIAMILAIAYVYNYSGLSATMGLAFANTGAFFPFFAPILGWLGVFLTGSDTSSNALFGNLQKTTAQQIGVSPELCVAANSTGGVTGKMISPQSISVATAATGLVGHEGDIFRFNLFHSLAMVLVLCLLTIAQAYVLKWMLP